jgi:hypothetical protein
MFNFKKNIKKIFDHSLEIIFFIFLLFLSFILLGMGTKGMANMAQNKPYDFAAINLFLTESLVVVTAFYTYFTFMMVREMKKSRERMDEPNIQITLEPQARWGNFFDLIIENLGNVSVFDLRIDIEPKGLKTLGQRKIEELNLFHRKIPVFGVRQKLKNFAISYVDFINSDQQKQISFIAEYRTKNNEQRTQKYDFDMEIYKGMDCETEKSLSDIANKMDNINSSLISISRNIKHPKS